jgi:hypothetical protein
VQLVRPARPLRCANFRIGDEPRIAINDGSLGRAAYFAARAEELVAVARTPEEALASARVECERAWR